MESCKIWTQKESCKVWIQKESCKDSAQKQIKGQKQQCKVLGSPRCGKQQEEFHLTVQHLCAFWVLTKIACFAVVVWLVAGLAFCQRRKIRQCFLKHDDTSIREEHKNRQHTAADTKQSGFNGSPSDLGENLYDTRKDQEHMVSDFQVQTPSTQIVTRQQSTHPPPLQRQLSLPLTPSKQQSNCSQREAHKCLSLPSASWKEDCVIKFWYEYCFSQTHRWGKQHSPTFLSPILMRCSFWIRTSRGWSLDLSFESKQCHQILTFSSQSIWISGKRSNVTGMLPLLNLLLKIKVVAEFQLISRPGVGEGLSSEDVKIWRKCLFLICHIHKL